MASIVNPIIDLFIPPTPATIYHREAFARRQWHEINNLPRKGYGQCGMVFDDQSEEEEIASLPKDINAILNDSCPFWSGRKIKDTHVLVRIPRGATIETVTALYLKEVRFPSEYYDMKEIATDPYWILITKEPVPSGSFDHIEHTITYPPNWQLLQQAYQFPKAVEFAAGLLAVAYREYGNTLFDLKQMKITIPSQSEYTVPCRETTLEGNCHLLMERSYEVGRYSICPGPNFGLMFVRKL